jgi:copper chaperone CopZ
MITHPNRHIDLVHKPLNPRTLLTARAALLSVPGMDCPVCALRVLKGLCNLKGVVLAEVLPERGRATVAYDPRQVTPEHLEQAVADAGNGSRCHYFAHVLSTLPARDVLTVAMRDA